MSILDSREIPIIITMIVGVITLFSYYLAIPQLELLSDVFVESSVIIAAFALAFVGPINILRFHSGVISRRDKGRWPFSVWMLFIMSVTMIMGIFEKPFAAGALYLQWYQMTIMPLNATFQSLTGFYITAVAYRTFKLRNIETSVLLIASVLVMLKNAAIGAVIWSGFVTIGTWIMDVPNTAGFRGIIISTGVGIIAYAVRILIGYERGHLGE